MCRNILIKFLAFVFFFIALVGCSKSGDDLKVVVDIDGNEYEVVKIGSQIWMKSNLKVKHYNDSTEIPNLESTDEWRDATSGGWVFYNNDGTNESKYGVLYNGYAAVSGKLCPTGWRVPTEEDWDILKEYLGGKDTAGYKMKTTSDWAIDGGGSNVSGFTALPAGYRELFGVTFSGLGDFTYFWTSSYSDTDIDNLGYTYVQEFYNGLIQAYSSLNFGFSCRCIKE